MQAPLRSTERFAEHIFNDWRDDVLTWARTSAPKLIAILITALILISLLRWVTRKLDVYSKEQPLPTGLRAQQLRTLASVVESVGTAIIVFLAAMQVMPLLGVDVKPILASAGI